MRGIEGKTGLERIINRQGFSCKNKNIYIKEDLYDLVPLLYNKGRLDDSTVNEIIKKFDLSETKIKDGLITDE